MGCRGKTPAWGHCPHPPYVLTKVNESIAGRKSHIKKSTPNGVLSSLHPQTGQQKPARLPFHGLHLLHLNQGLLHPGSAILDAGLRSLRRRIVQAMFSQHCTTILTNHTSFRKFDSGVRSLVGCAAIVEFHSNLIKQNKTMFLRCQSGCRGGALQGKPIPDAMRPQIPGQIQTERKTLSVFNVTVLDIFVKLISVKLRQLIWTTETRIPCFQASKLRVHALQALTLGLEAHSENC